MIAWEGCLGQKENGRAIDIDQKHFDSDHPNLATSYNNLAHIALAEGRRDEACTQFRRAYAIFIQHFPSDHPSVKKVTNSLEMYCGGVPSAK